LMDNEKAKDTGNSSINNEKAKYTSIDNKEIKNTDESPINNEKANISALSCYSTEQLVRMIVINKDDSLHDKILSLIRHGNNSLTSNIIQSVFVGLDPENYSNIVKLTSKINLDYRFLVTQTLIWDIAELFHVLLRNIDIYYNTHYTNQYSGYDLNALEKILFNAIKANSTNILCEVISNCKCGYSETLLRLMKACCESENIDLMTPVFEILLVKFIKAHEIKMDYVEFTKTYFGNTIPFLYSCIINAHLLSTSKPKPVIEYDEDFFENVDADIEDDIDDDQNDDYYVIKDGAQPY
jgi:hypothetical protein